MNILLISTNKSASSFPVLPAGTCTVAEAAQRNGHAVTVLDRCCARLGGASLGVMPEEIMRATRFSLPVTGDGETVFPGLSW